MTVPEIKAKLNKANVGTTIDKTTTENHKSDDSINKIDDEIKGKHPENELNNPKLNIINLFNNIVIKINMGNEDLKVDIENLKNSILNVVETKWRNGRKESRN